MKIEKKNSEVKTHFERKLERSLNEDSKKKKKIKTENNENTAYGNISNKNPDLGF